MLSAIKKTSPAAVKVGNDKQPEAYIRQRVSKANQIGTVNASWKLRQVYEPIRTM